MNSALWTLFLLCILFDANSSDAFECNPTDHCTCYPEDFEIHCPSTTEDLIIHIDEKKSEILIDCPRQIFHLHHLPNVPLNTTHFRMRFCPWPEEEFHRILDKFSLSNVTLFEFSASPAKDTILQRRYFEGIEEIRRLKLSATGIVDVDEDVFVSTPNLLVLELDDNNITLKKNLFRNAPHLTFLDLSGNSLENIPPGAFQPLKKLKALHLWNNSLRELDGQVFKGLTRLQSLELSRNKVEHIPDDAFHELINLTQINLSANNIKQVTSSLFKLNKKLKLVKLSSNSNLKLTDHLFSNSPVAQLDLSKCRLKSIPEHVFQNCTHLKIVSLAENRLEYLPENLFQGAANLERIELHNNSIRSVSKVFRGLSRLKWLYLHNNLISVLIFEDFADLVNLEKINLRGNRIGAIDGQVFGGKSNLQVVNLSHNFLNCSLDQIVTLDAAQNLSKLDLSHNLIPKLKLSNLKTVTTDIFLKLDHNQISVVNFEDVDLFGTFVRILLSHNPIGCDCRNVELVDYFKNREKNKFTIDISARNLYCVGPPELKNESVDTLSPLLTCPLHSSCPKNCLCSWRRYDRSLIIDCSYKNLTDYPQLHLSQVTSVDFNQTELHLEGNHLTAGPEASAEFHNVTRLFLSGNKIRTIKWLPHELKVLTLDHNDLSHLNRDVMRILTRAPLANLTLHANPWRCDCGSELLADLLRMPTTPVHETDLFCHNSTRRLLDLKRDDFCQNWKNAHSILAVLSVLLVLSIYGVIYCRFQREMKMWLFSKNLCLWWVTERELDRDKTYDAFISYSHKDEDFVSAQLLPVLETNYKLCLHYRDWIPGEFISAQVVDSVKDSRRTVVVLSKNFTESTWCRTEFQTAHSQALIDGRTRVIILLLGDVSIDDLSGELKMYLKTSTYVKWGDRYFWEKLKYALPHKRIAGGRRRRLVSEDCTLIECGPSNPGCTPPISLNPSFSTINPLSLANGRGS